MSRARLKIEKTLVRVVQNGQPGLSGWYKMDKTRQNPAQSLIARSGVATIAGLFSQQVASSPDHLAIVDGARRMSYRELEERTNRLANVLLNQGLGAGARVAILSRNRLEYLELELAAAKAGLIVAALNWRLAKREMAHCITLVNPDLILVEPALSDQLAALDIPSFDRITIGKDYENQLSQASPEAPVCDLDPEMGLIILYTSGTTGLPKGALISHRALIARAMSFASELQLPRQDTFCAWAPLYHMASADHSLASLIRGGTVHVVDGYQPEKMIEFLAENETGLFFLLPGMVRRFIDDWRKKGARARGLVACGAMADLVPPEDIAEVTALLNAPYFNSFGSTETGLPPASASFLEIGKLPKSLSKKQSAMCELRLVDDDDIDVAPGTPGEVALRGPTLFSGYWNADTTNLKDFRNGWFHMGDVMRRNPDGTLDYVDRKKYMIKSGGENIYPAEIEAVLLTDPGVAQAIVVKQADATWGEVPVAFVVPKDTLDPAALQEHCTSHLSRYKRPKRIILIQDSDIPRSTTGKVQRHVLEEKLGRSQI